MKHWLLTITLALLALLLALDLSKAPARAAGGGDGCETVGTVGAVIIARCIDDMTGALVWANSAGFMAVEP